MDNYDRFLIFLVIITSIAAIFIFSFSMSMIVNAPETTNYRQEDIPVNNPLAESNGTATITQTYIEYYYEYPPILERVLYAIGFCVLGLIALSIPWIFAFKISEHNFIEEWENF